MGWIAIAALSGCLGNDVVKSGTLDVRITDAAVDGASHVVLEFRGIDLHSKDGTQTFIYDTPRQLDLLDYQGGRFEVLLGPVEVPAGNYDWIRLRIGTAAAGDSYIEFGDGTRHELTVVTSDNVGVRVTQTVNVPVDDFKSVTIDFDLRKSLRESGGNYSLTPVLRVVDSNDAGRIKALADPLFFAAPECANGAMAYVFSGNNATPVDISGGVSDPVTTAPFVKFSVTGLPDTYIADVVYLPEGDYTVALTCDGYLDLPDSSEVLTFLTQQNATVIRNLQTTIALASELQASRIVDISSPPPP